MQVLQVLLVITVAASALARTGPTSVSSERTSISSGSITGSITGSNSDSGHGSNTGLENYEGKVPYLLIYRLHGSDHNKLRAKNGGSVIYDVYFWPEGNRGRINETSNSSSGISGSKTNGDISGDRAQYPYIYKWHKGFESNVKHSIAKNIKKRYRRQSEGGSRCPCFGRPRGGPSQPRNNWQPRTGEPVFRTAFAGSRRLFGSDAKGGFPFPHSERRRRKRSCCGGLRSRSNANVNVGIRTDSLRVINVKAGDLDDPKGGFPFPHSCKKR